MIYAKPVTLRVTVREKPSLQHLVRRGTNAGHKVSGVEGRLFDICKVIVRIAIQDQSSYLLEWVISVVPHLSQIKRIEAIVGRFGRRHYLHLKCPGGKFAAFNRM